MEFLILEELQAAATPFHHTRPENIVVAQPQLIVANSESQWTGDRQQQPVLAELFVLDYLFYYSV